MTRLKIRRTILTTTHTRTYSLTAPCRCRGTQNFVPERAHRYWCSTNPWNVHGIRGKPIKSWASPTNQQETLTTHQIIQTHIHADMSIDAIRKNDGPSRAHIHAHTRCRVHEPAATRKTLRGHSPGRASLDKFITECAGSPIFAALEACCLAGPSAPDAIK